MTELRPCPFCGGEARLIDSECGTTIYAVECVLCQAKIGWFDEKERAIKEWNNRPSPWHTGTPTEAGWYLVAYRKCDCDGSLYWDYGTRVWEDYGEYGHWNITSMKYPVIKWQKINELVEED